MPRGSNRESLRRHAGPPACRPGGCVAPPGHGAPSPGRPVAAPGAQRPQPRRCRRFAAGYRAVGSVHTSSGSIAVFAHRRPAWHNTDVCVGRLDGTMTHEPAGLIAGLHLTFDPDPSVETRRALGTAINDFHARTVPFSVERFALLLRDDA